MTWRDGLEQNFIFAQNQSKWHFRSFWSKSIFFPIQLLRGNSSIVKKLSKRSFFVKKFCVLTLTFWQKKSHQKRVSRHAPIWHLLTAHLPMDICCPDILTRPGNLQIHWSTKDIHPFSAFFAPPLPLCPLSIHSRLNPLRRKSYSPRPPFLKIFWSIFFCNIFKKSFVLW